MIQVGDRVVCVDGFAGGYWSPAVRVGNEYIVNSIVECCGRVSIGIGLEYKHPAMATSCPFCHIEHKISTPHYNREWFRKIEPEYKAVMVDSEISEQAKELIGITETIAR